MKRLKNITILLCFLSLLAFISCSAEDKMGGKTTIDGDLILDGSNIENGRYESRNAKFNVSKWRKTTKDGKITKTEAVEIEPYKIIGNRKLETPTFTEVIYDYETKTLSITCKVTIDGSEKTLSTKSEKYTD